MKNLQYWQDKWQKNFEKFQEHRSYYYSLKAHYLWGFYREVKLKKQYGCGLTRKHYSFKTAKRRARWFKQRLSLFTKFAYHRKEMIRLAQTKMIFIENKILALGGKVDKFWASDYHSVLKECKCKS